MPSLAKKWTKELPYVYVDSEHGERRMVLYWWGSKQKCTTYARWFWERVNGSIPDDMVVHHINEDKMDDRIENYELRSNSKHTPHYHKTKGKPG